MIFWIAYLISGLVIFLAIADLAQVRRVSSMRERWRRASGRILEFGVTHGRPHVRYNYQVDGKRYESDRLIPGIRGSGVSGSAPLRRTWIDAYGRLLYPSGAEVVVYHHPDDPTDATLYPGVGYRPFVGLAFGLLLIGGTLAAQIAGPVAFKQYKPVLLSGLLFLGTFLLLLLALRNLWNFLRGRDFSSVEGRIVKAAPEPTGRNGFRLAVRYEYYVEGIRYLSGALSSSGMAAVESQDKVQAAAEAFLANPKVRVWYDPRRPWVCFLRNGPLAAILLLFALSFALGVVAVLVLSSGR